MTSPAGSASSLTDRQLDALALFQAGLDTAAVARAMQVSVLSVRGHRREAIFRLGVLTLPAAIEQAIELDLLPATPATARGARHVR